MAAAAQARKIPSWLKSVKGLLLDINGVLYDNGPAGSMAIQGSVDAVNRLKGSKFPVKFCTNETQLDRNKLVTRLEGLGFQGINSSDLVCPAPLLADQLTEEKMRPFLLVHPDVVSEFEKLEKQAPNCVVIGDAAEHGFTYERLNETFNLLLSMSIPRIYCMGFGRYYKETDGMKLDVGSYARALEYACDVKAEIIGKPMAKFFQTAIDELKMTPADVLMVGDDLKSDVGGAQKVGMKGVQVRTGKFRPADEKSTEITADCHVDNLYEIVDMVLTNRA